MASVLLVIENLELVGGGGGGGGGDAGAGAGSSTAGLGGVPRFRSSSFQTPDSRQLSPAGPL